MLPSCPEHRTSAARAVPAALATGATLCLWSAGAAAASAPEGVAVWGWTCTGARLAATSDGHETGGGLHPWGSELSPALQAKRRGPTTDLMDEDEKTDGTVSRPGADFFEDYKSLMKKASTAEMIRRSGRQSIEIRVDIGERPDGCP